MATLVRSSSLARRIGVAATVAVLTGFWGHAFAQSRAAGAETAPLTVAMGPGASAPEERPSPAVARYFTINDIVSKLDTQKVNAATNNQPTQIATRGSTNPSGQEKATAAIIPQGDEPFGLATFRAPEGQLWVKWRKLAKELQAEAQVLAQCQANARHCSNPAAQKFLDLIEASRNLSGRAKIDRINRAINFAVRYTTDQAQYGVPDLWTAPLATLSSGQGDCEDYAIAKYVALREAGVSADDLRLLLVHDRVARQDHAVVGVRQNDRWLMLDNRHEILIEQNDAWHFTPLFALDREGVKLFAAPHGAPQVTGPAQVATGPAKTAEPVSSASSATREATELVPELRLDAFEAPELRGRL